MPKFEVELRRTYIKTIIIEAEDEDDAQEKANKYSWDIGDADDVEDDFGTIDEVDE